jgi:uncharacterized membrane protein
MFRIVEMILQTAFWSTLLILTLLAIWISNLLRSDWFLLLVPIFYCLSVYIFLYVEEYSNDLLISYYQRKFRKEKIRSGDN